MTQKVLAGKAALVTGASRGLGKAIALKLAQAGCSVTVNYHSNDDLAASLVEQINSWGGQAFSYKADVSDADAVKTMVRETAQKWGKIDILVNNAGITRDGMIMRMSESAWDDVLDTNLKSAFLCTRFVLRSMIEQPEGRIINISSLAGLMGNPGQANYCAAKAGLIALTRTLAKELGPRNITVNAIAPGFIVSDMTDKLPQEAKDNILSQVPLNRFGKPEDIAALALFLAGPAASYISGQVIAVDGGLM